MNDGFFREISLRVPAQPGTFFTGRVSCAAHFCTSLSSRVCFYYSLADALCSQWRSQLYSCRHGQWHFRRPLRFIEYVHFSLPLQPMSTHIPHRLPQSPLLPLRPLHIRPPRLQPPPPPHRHPPPLPPARPPIPSSPLQRRRNLTDLISEQTPRTCSGE